MKQYLLNVSILLLFTACTTTQQTASATTSAPKEGTDKVEAAFVFEESGNNNEFEKVDEKNRVENYDSTAFTKEFLMEKVREINTYMGETGSASLSPKGIVVTFERGDLFGLTSYVANNNAQSDYRKLVKALNTFKGTVIVAGKTGLSASDKSKEEAEKRALRVARFISKADITKDRILLDDMGVSFASGVARKAKVTNKDRVVEFLLIPEKE
jgi:hypothetical protein